MPPRKLKEKRKAPTPKTPTVKEVPQESAAVLWLMERTGFDKNELVCAWPCVPPTMGPPPVSSITLTVPT